MLTPDQASLIAGVVVQELKLAQQKFDDCQATYMDAQEALVSARTQLDALQHIVDALTFFPDVKSQLDPIITQVQ